MSASANHARYWRTREQYTLDTVRVEGAAGSRDGASVSVVHLGYGVGKRSRTGTMFSRLPAPAPIELLHGKADRGRFPRQRGDLPDNAVDHVARQIARTPASL